MCSLLYECGVKVEKISVIKDDIDTIANEIHEFSERYKYVITSGGIGPTHDDMTFDGLAKAFNDTLDYHPRLFEIIKKLYKTDDKSSPAFKMANIPASSVLNFGKNQQTGELLTFPCVNVENVYVFPGSPVYLEPLFKSLYKELFKTSQSFVKSELFIDAKEELFADALTKVSKEFKDVAFGSYPVTDQCYYKARVTIESNNENTTSKAKDRFCSLVCQKVFVNYDKSPEIDAVDKFYNLIKSCEYSDNYTATIQDIKEIFSEPSEVAIAFDGSIESTVLIHLAHVALEQSKSSGKINAVVFRNEEFYPETDKYIEEISNRYNLQIKNLSMPLKDALENLKTLDNKNIKILLLGIKSKDKTTGIFHKLYSDSKLPISIACPLIGWTSENLWALAKSLSLPYCPLYDKGFSCIGDKTTTKPDSKLIIDKVEGRTIYLPAWKLQN
ncbi:FAD synthase-like isoform X2 [Aphidius gifuensis]|nr:FAD synthase-like isoform X2 [Aphidius gifuensis]